jgi:hypothetical protein
LNRWTEEENKSRCGGVVQVPEHLPSKCKALSSLPAPQKKIKIEILSSLLINRPRWWDQSMLKGKVIENPE